MSRARRAALAGTAPTWAVPTRAVLAGAVLAGAVLAGCASGPDGADGVPEPGPAGGTLSTTLAPEAGDVTGLLAAADLTPCPAPASAPAVAGGLPDLVLDCLGGGPAVRLSGLRGPLLLNVWASWCGPCEAEAPVLAAFAGAHGRQVPVLGVDIGDTRAGGLGAAARWGADFSSVQDPAEALRAGLRPPYVGPPATYLLRADGTLAPLVLGPVTAVAQLEAALAEQGVALGAA